jgi:hypothetical protein
MKNKTFQMLINLFVEKWRNLAREKNHWIGASRTRQVSTKANCETRETLGQSAERSVAVSGQGRRGATVPDVCLPGAAEQKVGIFLGRALDCENLGFCVPAT